MLVFKPAQTGPSFSIDNIGSPADLCQTVDAIFEAAEIILCDTHLAAQPENQNLLFYLLRIARHATLSEPAAELLADVVCIQNAAGLTGYEIKRALVEKLGLADDPTRSKSAAPLMPNPADDFDTLAARAFSKALFPTEKAEAKKPAPSISVVETADGKKEVFVTLKSLIDLPDLPAEKVEPLAPTVWGREKVEAEKPAAAEPKK